MMDNTEAFGKFWTQTGRSIAHQQGSPEIDLGVVYGFDNRICFYDTEYTYLGETDLAVDVLWISATSDSYVDLEEWA